MGILNLILLSASEANFSCSLEDGIATTSLQELPTSCLDVAITGIICLAVCISIFILTNGIRKTISTKSVVEKDSTPSDTDNKDSKEEYKITPKDQYEAAWRFVNMCWKVEHPEMLKDKNGILSKPEKLSELTPEDKIRYEQAWSVVRKYIDANTSEKD